MVAPYLILNMLVVNIILLNLKLSFLYKTLYLNTFRIISKKKKSLTSFEDDMQIAKMRLVIFIIDV